MKVSPLSDMLAVTVTVSPGAALAGALTLMLALASAAPGASIIAIIAKTIAMDTTLCLFIKISSHSYLPQARRRTYLYATKLYHVCTAYFNTTAKLNAEKTKLNPYHSWPRGKKFQLLKYFYGCNVLPSAAISAATTPE